MSCMRLLSGHTKIGFGIVAGGLIGHGLGMQDAIDLAIVASVLTVLLLINDLRHCRGLKMVGRPRGDRDPPIPVSPP